MCVWEKVDGVVSGNQSWDIPDPFQFSPSFGTSSYPQHLVHGQFQRRRAISCCYTRNATTNTTAEKMIHMDHIDISTTWTFSLGSGEFGGHVTGKTPLFETTLNNKPSHFSDWWHKKRIFRKGRRKSFHPCLWWLKPIFWTGQWERFKLCLWRQNQVHVFQGKTWSCPNSNQEVFVAKPNLNFILFISII